MKIAGVEHSVQSGGVMEKATFSMANNAHAFATMSDRLYSDKITAVIREVTINAADAHIEFGTPNRKVKVHLPTYSEPVFSVQDFGPGLSHENMMYLYTTYFASTKTGDNSNTGGFGLGCKAPFAYASGFSVESIFEGVLRVYSAIKGEDGKPEMNLLSEEPTDNHSGLTVSMPVRNTDHSEFQRKGQRVLEFIPHFEVNLPDFKASKTHYVSKKALWGIRDMAKDIHIGHNRPRAIMGKVAYPFTLDESKLTADHKAILALPMDLFFEIGDVAITPAREALDMRKMTFDAIVARLEAIHSEILESVKAEVQSAKSIWFAKLALRDRLSDSSPFKPLIKKALSTFFGQYSNFFLNNVHTSLDMRGYSLLDVGMRRFQNYNDKLAKLVFDDDRSRITIETSGLSFFYLHDGPEQPTRISKRVIELLRAENPGKDLVLYLITAPRGSEVALVEAELAVLEVALGNPDIIRTSSLPPVPKKTRGPRAPSDTCKYAWIFRNRYSSDSADMWSKVTHTEFEGDGPFYYIPLDRLIPCNGMEPSAVVGVWQSLRALNITISNDDDDFTIEDTTPLYGLNRLGQDRVKNNSNWINIFEIVKATTFDLPMPYLQHRASLGLQQVTDGLGRVMKHYIQIKMRGAWRNHLKGTNFHRQAVLVRRLNQLISRWTNTASPMFKSWNAIVTFNQQKIRTVSISSEITKLKSALDLPSLTSRYPMLELLNNYMEFNQTNIINILGPYIASQEALPSLTSAVDISNYPMLSLLGTYIPRDAANLSTMLTYIAYQDALLAQGGSDAAV